MTEHVQWWNDTRADLVRGGLWLRGEEPNRIPPREWGSRDFRVLFSRLSTWEDTCESFTHRLLYGIVSDLPGIFPDLAWIPPFRDGERMSADGVPWMLGSGTKRGVEEFDCLALSNALVQELVNIPVVLERSGIPLSRSERMARTDLPLVILGGANALYTSALFGPEPMVDGIFLGEEPATIRELFQRLARAKSSGATKPEALGTLLDLPGFFVPDNFRPAARKIHAPAPDLNRHKVREVGVPVTGAADSASLQISEGCPYFCSFCAESWSRKPYREVPIDEIRRDALEIKRELGLSKLDLYSFNFNTCENVRPMVAGLLEDFDSVGLKSQRFDAVAHDPTFPRLLKLAGKTTITCGLEGISPRIRTFLQKDLTDDELYRSLSFLLSERLRELKVFLIATGRETEEDFDEFRMFLKRLRELLTRAASNPRVVFSATPLVCFPWTPLEFQDMPAPKELSRIVGMIKGAAVSAGFEFRGAAGIEEAWVSQVLVRARDGRVMEAVRRAQATTGFVFRDRVTEEFHEAFRQELTSDGVEPESFLRGFGTEEGVDRPWSDLEPGVSRRFLVSEWEKCGRFEQTPVCLGWVDEPGKCHACGACTPPEREAIVHARENRPQDLAVLERKLKSLRASEEVVAVRVELSDFCLGLPMQSIHARHARAWMKVLDVVRGYRRHDPCGRKEESDDCIASGLEVLHPVLFAPAAALVREGLANPDVLERVNALFSPYGRILSETAPLPDDSAWDLELPEAPDLTGWLSERGLKHTMRREGAVRVFEPAKESLKKKILRSARLSGNGGSWHLRLEGGAKFSINDLLRGAVTHRARNLAIVRRIS